MNKCSLREKIKNNNEESVDFKKNIMFMIYKNEKAIPTIKKRSKFLDDINKNEKKYLEIKIDNFLEKLSNYMIFPKINCGYLCTIIYWIYKNNKIDQSFLQEICELVKKKYKTFIKKNCENLYEEMTKIYDYYYSYKEYPISEEENTL